MLASKREQWVVKVLKYFQNNNGFTYFHQYIPIFLSQGNSTWGYVDPDGISESGMLRAFYDLEMYHDIFRIEPEYAEREYSKRWDFKEGFKCENIEFGKYAAERTYRVLSEIYKFGSIRDFKLFGKHLNGKYYYLEVEDLRAMGLVIYDDGSKGSRTYTITDKGKELCELRILKT